MCLLFALGGFALGLAAGTALHLLAGRRRKEEKPVPESRAVQKAKKEYENFLSYDGTEQEDILL